MADLSEFAPGNSSAGGGGLSQFAPGASTASLPAPSAGGIDLSQFAPGGAAAASAAPASKSGGGLFGHLKSLGSQLGNFVNPAKLAGGLVKLGDEGLQAVGLAPTQVLHQAENAASIIPGLGGLEQKPTSFAGSAVQAITGDSNGQKGLHVIAQQTPALYGAGKHVGQTAQALVDEPVNVAENVAAPVLGKTGPGYGNSILGRRIQQEGVIGAAGSTLGDALLLAGVGGAGLDAAGAGDLAEASRLENLANSVKGSPEEGYASAAHADQMAQEAAANGDATQAAEHAQAAQNLSKAEDLRANVANSSRLNQVANTARQGLGDFSHAGGAVFEAPYKLTGAAVGAIPGVPEAAAAAGEAIGNSRLGLAAKQFAQNRADNAQFRGIYRDQMQGETQRLQGAVNQAAADVKRLLPNAEDQQALNLVRRGDVNPLTAPQLSQLSDAQLQAHIDKYKLDATPAAMRTAIDYTANPGARPEMGQAAQIMDRVQQASDARYANGYGASQVLGEPQLQERAAKVAGEASPGGVANRQAAIDKMIKMQQDRINEAMQGGLGADRAPLSAAQERAQAARNARADVTERLGSERQGISTRAAADETNVRQQALASKRAVADAEREIAARSQRISDLQGRRAGVPNELKVQAPQVRTAVQSADQIRQSLLQAAQEAHAAGDVAEGQRLAKLAGKASPTAADLRSAGIEPQFLPGGTVPEEGAARPGGGRPRLAQAKKLGSERMRQTTEAPLTVEGQAAKYNETIAGQVRNELSRRVLDELAQPSTAHVADATLRGADLRQALADQGRVPVGLVPEGGVAKLRPLADDDPRLRAGVPTLSQKMLDRYTKTAFPSEPGALMKGLRTVENAGRLIKLLGPGFVMHKGITDALLDRIVGGVPLKDVVANVPEAYRQYKEGTLPADIGQLTKPNMENASAVDRALNTVAEKGMVGFRALDSTNRGALYQSLRDQGYSPVQAAEKTRAVAGDIKSVNQQAGAARHVLTYPGWQMHLASVLKDLALHHPGGVLQAGALASAANRAEPEVNPTTGGLDEALNPFGSFIGLGKGLPGQSLGTQVEKRLGSMVAPLLEFGGQAAGVDIRKGQNVQVPGVPFPQTPGPQILNLPNLGNMALHTFVPQLGQIGDVAGLAHGAGGQVPYRLTTGQPEKNSAGEVQMQPGSTRLGAAAKLAGIPLPQKAAPAKPKKKR